MSTLENVGPSRLRIVLQKSSSVLISFVNSLFVISGDAINQYRNIARQYAYFYRLLQVGSSNRDLKRGSFNHKFLQTMTYQVQVQVFYYAMRPMTKSISNQIRTKKNKKDGM